MKYIKLFEEFSEEQKMKDFAKVVKDLIGLGYGQVWQNNEVPNKLYVVTADGTAEGTAQEIIRMGEDLGFVVDVEAETPPNREQNTLIDV